MGILGSMLHWYMKKRVHQIELFTKHPIETQNQILTDLLYKSKETDYGKLHHFSSAINYERYQEQVPLVTYEDFQPFIEKARKGQKNVAWPGKIKWFAKSSGTTNAKSKFIPISEESLVECHYKAGKDLFSLYVNNHPNSTIFDCKNLRLGGSSELYKGYETVYGDLSAILIDNLPFWTDFVNTPNRKVSLMTEWESKINAIIESVTNEDVGSLTGVPSWMLVLLQKILQTTKYEYLDDLWPNLEVFFHGGISFIPYAEQYQSIFKKNINYYEIYNASEGFFGAQDQSDSKDLLLMLDYGIFYEFIPMNDFFNENPTTISLENVELNKNYALVISTNGGLWRYIIGDTVKFVSLNPHRIIVTGRTKHYINAFGEELMIENAETALLYACQNTDSIIHEYTAAPIYMEAKGNGAHQWLIEFKKKPTSIEDFTRKLDEKLKELNSDYEAKRYNNMTLRMPEVAVAQENIFYEWMKKRNKLGGQNKIPRLVNDREYIDDLLSLNKKLIT